MGSRFLASISTRFDCKKTIPCLKPKTFRKFISLAQVSCSLRTANNIYTKFAPLNLPQLFSVQQKAGNGNPAHNQIRKSYRKMAPNWCRSHTAQFVLLNISCSCCPGRYNIYLRPTCIICRKTAYDTRYKYTAALVYCFYYTPKAGQRVL